MRPSKRAQRGFGVHPEWAEFLPNVHFVLSGVTHPGNIGAVARVMKNMALTNLNLVSSTYCGPDSDAYAMASGAYEIVEHARISDTLEQALKGCVMAVGTSARIGNKRSDARVPQEVIPELVQNARKGPVACVFGREARGLTNEELKLCTHLMIIPTDAEFASMNVAHAAAVAGYEIFRIMSRPIGFKARKRRPASLEKREEMFEHVEQVLIRSGFLDGTYPLRMMRDIRRILNSAELDDRDVKIIRGIFRTLGNMVRIADEKVQRLEQMLNKGQKSDE
jgi:TrmH family RNA methyltransferase